MPSNYEVLDSSREQNPMLGLIGFIVLIVVGGISYGVSGPLLQYITRTKLVLGAAQVLPLKFPADWTPLGNQMAVAFGVFLVLFVISMVILFMFMKPMSDDEQSVNLDVLRQEVKARKKSR